MTPKLASKDRQDDRYLWDCSRMESARVDGSDWRVKSRKWMSVTGF